MSLAVQSDTVNDVLERMPTFWQDPGAPVEHPLTTFVFLPFSPWLARLSSPFFQIRYSPARG